MRISSFTFAKINRILTEGRGTIDSDLVPLLQTALGKAYKVTVHKTDKVTTSFIQIEDAEVVRKYIRGLGREIGRGQLEALKAVRLGTAKDSVGLPCRILVGARKVLVDSNTEFTAAALADHWTASAEAISIDIPAHVNFIEYGDAPMLDGFVVINQKTGVLLDVVSMEP